MLKVRFPQEAEDEKLRFAVIVARYRDKWVLCKHRDRESYECPGGHREAGEAITDTAGRELYEETGAVGYTLVPVSVYSVDDGERETFGMLYYADIHALGPLPPSEIEKVELMDELPRRWTYPQIQPLLLEKVRSCIAGEGPKAD